MWHTKADAASGVAVLRPYHPCLVGIQAKRSLGPPTELKWDQIRGSCCVMQ